MDAPGLHKPIMYNYQDICLTPKCGILKSRALASTAVNFLGGHYKSPVIPANMQCVIDYKLAETLALNGYFYILHRFYPYPNVLEWIKSIKWAYDGYPVSLSVGVKEHDKQFIEQLKPLCLPFLFITIDIAHGYSLQMKEMIKFIKKTLPKARVIAGNAAGDSESVIALGKWGADAIKVGIGQGAGCTTYDCTGFCSPMFTAGLDAAADSKVPLIGDGGIRTPGDIAKAIRAGYDMVMIGSLFAECIDSPAVLFNTAFKQYYGSASKKAKGHNTHVEGKDCLLPLDTRTYIEKHQYFEECLRSAISYSGGQTLTDIREVNFDAIRGN